MRDRQMGAVEETSCDCDSRHIGIGGDSILRKAHA